MDRSSIEVLSIVQKTKGIHCKVAVNVVNNHDQDNYDSLFHILFSVSETKKALKKEIKSALKMPSIKDLSVQRIKEKSKRMKTMNNDTKTKIEMQESQNNGEKKKEKSRKDKPKKKKKNQK